MLAVESLESLVLPCKQSSMDMIFRGQAPHCQSTCMQLVTAAAIGRFRLNQPGF
jgi:hypothetical protein